MSFEQLHTFVTVVEEGSLRSAAVRMHITEPPLSRRIAQLEEELGARLFDRHARGMALSAQGERFLVHARTILDAVARARSFLDEAEKSRDATASPHRIHEPLLTRDP